MFHVYTNGGDAAQESRVLSLLSIFTSFLFFASALIFSLAVPSLR